MRKHDSLWVVIHMAHSLKRCDAAVELLSGEGFMVRSRLIDKALDGGEDCYEILALNSEAKEARDFLRERGF